MPAIMKIRVGSGRCEHVIHKLSIGINLPLFGGPVARGQRGTMTITTPFVMGAADSDHAQEEPGHPRPIAQNGRLSGSSFSGPAAAFQ
jgi:hypothetical protein